MFDSLKVGCIAVLTKTVHGFANVTEDYTGEVVSLGREGDEQFVILQLLGGQCKFWEGDTVRVSTINRTAWEVRRQRLAKYHNRQK